MNDVRDSRSEWQQEQKKVEEVINSYFTRLFSSITPAHIEETVANIEGRVSQEFDAFLSMPFTKMETKEALFHNSDTCYKSSRTG